MLLRLCVCGVFAFVTIFFLEETFVRAQATTDFASWKDVQNAEAVPNWAGQMLRRFRDVTGTAREELLTKTFAALKEIASDDHVVPSTRYNAILAAGQLVSREPSPGNLPVAYSAALPYLIEVYQKPDTPHYLKYGALLGIVRHTISGIDAAQQDHVIDLLLETVTTEFKADEVALNVAPFEPAAWDWFRQTALDGLAALKTAGTDNKVITELLAVIHYKSQELENFCLHQGAFTRREREQSRRAIELASKAAKTLGDLDYTLVSNIDATAMTDAFIRLTRAVCLIESKAASDFIEQEKTPLDPARLLERIIVNVKMCTQSVVWGIRSGFLPVSPAVKPGENSFYASLKEGDPAIGKLDVLLTEIIELAVFLDEGDKANRSVTIPNAPKELKFGLPELRDVLAKTSEVLAKIQHNNSDAPTP